MKKLSIFLIVVIVLLAGGTLAYEKLNPTKTTAELMATPTSQSEESPSLVVNSEECLPEELLGTVALDAGAGNINGTVTIKNVSPKECLIKGDQYLYGQSTESNFTLSQQGPVGAEAIMLIPNQEAFSKLHYPNGPQCEGSTKEAKISFTYPISTSQPLVFKDDSGEVEQPIQLCASADQNTEVQVWSLTPTL